MRGRVPFLQNLEKHELLAAKPTFSLAALSSVGEVQIDFAYYDGPRNLQKTAPDYTCLWTFQAKFEFESHSESQALGHAAFRNQT
jgi:hypothetical protein